MHPDHPLALLGGLTPSQFMKTYWQRKPLLVRQAFKNFKPPVSMATLKKMCRREDVESRLVWQEKGEWNMEVGPFSRLPKMSEQNWTLLVQSVDIHDDDACALMNQFRFVPDARLDDLMISMATQGGGVGPHFDSYDVFLLQAQGRRVWKFGQQKDLSLVPGLPLKILQNFEPEQEFVLEPGDMLYLPPQAAHDGIALDDCMTISIGFRAPDEAALARGMLEAAMDQILARAGVASGPYGEPALPGPNLSKFYRDSGQTAVANPAEIPERLTEAAIAAASKIRFDRALATRFLGCWLTEPNQHAVFECPPELAEDTSVQLGDGSEVSGHDWTDADDLDEDQRAQSEPYTHWVLDRRTRMLYRDQQLFINGETAPVKAEPGLRKLADARELAGTDPSARKLSAEALEMLAEWIDDGWIRLAQK
ncbi:cupin domain-containing protein [Zwartia sp.]|uniref:cupin domain-containing protein n=1 Tax=Zwartia sp. TaxID=2978004 RepID=UPI002725C4A0|nr:cupin domain-containing protein [Zwartia sp.]MDO9024669.1 cupin domain-containing protein [Zwartia sp.]